MNLKKVVAGLAAGLSLSIAAGAQAAVLSFEDDDIDFALNSNLEVQTSGTIGTGTILVSVFEIPIFTISGANAIPTGQELTGVAAVQITGGDGTLANPWTFSAVTVGMNEILALGAVDATVTGGEAGGGATLAMWFNSTDPNLEVNRTTNPASNCDDIADCIDAASAGTLFQVDGFAGDPDEFWISTLALLGGDDIETVLGTANDRLVATFNASQTTLFQAGGFVIGGINIQTGLPCVNTGGLDGCVDGGNLSGTITGGQGLSNGAFAHSDFDATKLTVAVPEPTTLLLLGAGLLGFGAFRRRN